jgi:tetratricopeptide (TPR) repeat protein
MQSRQAWMAGFLALGLLWPAPGRSQPAPLPPEARSAVDRGLANAQAGNFAGAENEFLSAWRLAPDDPQIWFDLGLAHSKLPGHELRAIAWFKLYLLKRPDASDAPAVRQQVAALETAFEAKMGAVADKLESVFALRNAELESTLGTKMGGISDGLESVSASGIAWRQRVMPTPQGAEALRRVATETGWSLAATRYALGDVAGAERGLAHTNGKDWVKSWKASWRRPDTSGETEQNLAISLASTGALNRALDLLQKIYNPGAADFFAERGDRRAEDLPVRSGASRAQVEAADACNEADLVPGALSNCRVVGWWGPNRETFLTKIGVNGVELDTAHDDTQILSYLDQQTLDEKPEFAFQAYPYYSSLKLSDLALDYRRLRGLDAPASASADRR